jgi:pimeloyl-ACP methyl ester carboxylesterase
MKKTAIWVLATVISCALIITALYFVLDPEKKDLTDAVRARSGGSYLRLSDGVTHYSFLGPQKGHVVVLLHGGTIPMFTWDEVAPLLVQQGFRVLMYDMFGRGYSDRPLVPYNRALHKRQLLELLNGLNLGDSLDLVGYSFGGAVAVDFTAAYPGRVARLALISPVVHHYPITPVMRPPVVGEVVLRLIGIPLMNKRANANYSGTSLAGHHAAAFNEQMTYGGFQFSILSLFRGDALVDHRDSYAAVGKQEHRVLLIWGARDMEITKDKIETARSLIPNAEYHDFQDAGHNIVFQKPGQVAKLLVAFFNGPPLK